MKNKLCKFFATTTVFAVIGLQTLLAIPVTGSIGFTGRAAVDSTSIGTSTEVVSWINPLVNGTSGAFASVADGTAVNMTAPWFFTTIVPINNFWSVGGFTFQLLSSVIQAQGGTSPNGYVVVIGTGIVSGNGYLATALNWNFTSQDPSVTSSPNSTFTFSSSGGNIPSVPDGGKTVGLLGLALLGVGFMKRKYAPSFT